MNLAVKESRLHKVLPVECFDKAASRNISGFYKLLDLK